MASYISSELYETNRFLVTGGAGFIGSNIVQHLLENNAGFIRVLDNFSTGFSRNLAPFEDRENLQIINGDIRDLNTCAKAVEGIDVVLHQAALGSVPRSINDPLTSHDVNVNGFLNMLHSSKEEGIEKFVYASSSSVYGDHPSLPKTEDRVGKPLSPYALTKSIDEQYADVYFKSYGFSTAGLRYFNVFGPRQSPEGPYAAVIPLFIKALDEHKPPLINGDGEQTRDFTFVENAIEANVKAAFGELKGARTYNVACGENCSINDLFRALASLAASELKPDYGPERPGDVRDSLADISNAMNDFGYTGNVKFEEGLKKTWEAIMKQNI